MITSMLCPACSSDKTREHSFGKVAEFRGFDVHAAGLIGFHCENCGYDFETPDQHDFNVDQLKVTFIQQREAAKCELKRLTGRQIKAIRVALELSQIQAADLFGGSANTFSRYETEEVVQPASMDRLIRLAAHLGKDGLAAIRASRDTNAVVPEKTKVYVVQGRARGVIGATLSLDGAGVNMLDVGSSISVDRERPLHAPVIIRGLKHGVNPVTDVLFAIK